MNHTDRRDQSVEECAELFAALREQFVYEEDTGRLRRVKSAGNHWKLYGKAVNSCGYRQRGFEGRTWGEHQLVFLWHHGWLPGEVDHRDQNKGNNRVWNLRPTTRSQNQYNVRAAQATNKLGVRGVRFRPGRSKLRPYVAQIKVGGKSIQLGHFATSEQAREIYEAARLQTAGEFAPTR